MGCSTRQFYRRLKDITEKSPAEIIKEYRLSIVERYLVTTTLSIEEIMYKAGYINKGTFTKHLRNLIKCLLVNIEKLKEMRTPSKILNQNLQSQSKKKFLSYLLNACSHL